MPESTTTKNMRDGRIRIVVGSVTYEVRFEDGDLTLDVPGPTVENYLDRGRLADEIGGQPELRYGEDQPMTGSFSARLRDLHSDEVVTLADFIAKAGAAAALGSTLGAFAEVQTVDLYWDVAGTIHGDGQNRTVYLPWVVIGGSFEEGSPNKISVNFTSYCLYPIFQ